MLVTGSAAGAVPPPTVLFKYKRIPSEIAENFPKEWGLGKTESGWMTAEAFYEFMADIFHPWLIKENITLPVIMFVDGHKSHLSMQLSQFCEKNGIVLVALFPNATHLLQPMDVAVFRSLKEYWRKKVHTWRLSSLDNPILKKKDFARILKEVIDDVLTPVILANGFRKSGLYPWNPQAIEIPLDNGVGNEKLEENYDFYQIGFNFLNKMIKQEKLEKFRRGNECELEGRDLALYELWKETKEKMKGLTVKTNVENDNLLRLDDSFLSQDWSVNLQDEYETIATLLPLSPLLLYPRCAVHRHTIKRPKSP